MRAGGGPVRRGSGAVGRLAAAAALAGILAVTPGLSASADDAPGAVDSAGQDQAGIPATTAPAPTPTLGGAGYGTNGGFGGAATFAPVPIDPSLVPDPPVNKDLPEQVDEKGPFEQQVSCDPEDRPGVTAFALLVSEHYDRPTFFGSRPCIDYASFHHDGRALDWPLNVWDHSDVQIADAVILWLTGNDGEMANRFGIEYLIWNGLIWSQERGWQYYTGNPHTDHIHFSFTWDGAEMRTSWWTGVAVTQPDLGPCDVIPWQYAPLHTVPRVDPCPVEDAPAAPSTGIGRVRPGESGAGVSMLQKLLDLPETGVLDGTTRAALLDWQSEHHVPMTGVADDFTYAVALGWDLAPLPDAALGVARKAWQTSEFTPYLRTTLTEGEQGKAVKVLQTAIGAEPDGSFGPRTAKALARWEKSVPVLAEQAQRRGDGPAVVTPLTWLLLERAVHPTMAVRDVQLERGSLDLSADPEGVLAAETDAEGRAGSPYAGGAVRLLQQLLGVDADGSFGPQTEKAVEKLQKSADLEPTGVVDGPTWVALEKVAQQEGRLEEAPGAAAAREARVKAEKVKAEKKAAKEKKAKEAAAEKARERAAAVAGID
ncbi:peptidoglycan-binding domain-containing protein [Ornithinimicrobium avium]|uniref:Uncharacterized protein n=1 Tax=Ornithinimicrobium avium TaxID=2283195 RepID=A0A345NPG7_9MICO|nr:peptidoglycan-binding protein [Ornithinimicrobium avium]AXH96925.1 hypothetical protein DV701_13080 [Ornithinimicrobium avium]